MKFEYILDEIGAGNRYQICLIVFLLIPTSFLNIFFEGIFLLSTPDHWCKVPGMVNLTFDQQQLIRPIDSNGKASNCERFDFDWRQFNGAILEQLNSTNELKILTNNLTLINCDIGWNYDTSVYTETAVTEASFFQI